MPPTKPKKATEIDNKAGIPDFDELAPDKWGSFLIEEIRNTRRWTRLAKKKSNVTIPKP